MEKQTDNRICKNCVHYMQHYILLNYRYRATASGHCIYCVGKNKQPTPCENWKEAPIKNTANNDTLKQTLQLMLKRLNEIVNALKDED